MKIIGNTNHDLDDIFGNGNFQVFFASGTFVAPIICYKVRVRCVGGGASGTASNGTTFGAGGGGGGFSIGVYTVVPGTSYTVTVGGQSGTSSFGTGPLIQATGGSGTSGGVGSLGILNFTGGSGAAGGAGNSGQQYGSGGGSAATLKGNGFNGYTGGSGGGNGGGVGGNATSNFPGGSCGENLKGSNNSMLIYSENPLGESPRFPFDKFNGGGQPSSPIVVYPNGCGGPVGGPTQYYAGIGGGGGGSTRQTLSGGAHYYGSFPGIGGGGGGGGHNNFGEVTSQVGGASGIVVIEW